jgi:hypothetical protein
LLCGLVFSFNIRRGKHAVLPRPWGGTVRCSDATGAQVYTEFANVPDAAQSTISNGVRLIRLNKTVFDSLSPLMQLFVYAHECGHHISGDIVEGVYFRHDNLAREQNADRIGIRLLRDQSGISLNQANEIAAAFQNNPAIPPYYLPGPLRAKWIVDCYQSHDDACKGSTVIYGGSPQPQGEITQKPQFGPLGRGVTPSIQMPPETQEGDLCDGLNTAIKNIGTHFTQLHSAGKNDSGDYVSSLVLPGATKCVITDPQNILMCTTPSVLADLVASVKECLEPLKWSLTEETPRQTTFLPQLIMEYSTDQFRWRKKWIQAIPTAHT